MAEQRHVAGLSMPAARRSGMRSHQTVAVPTQTPYNGSNPSGSSGPLGAGQALGVEA